MAGELIRLYLSGGASNSDPNASIGGVQSSTQILGQSGAFDGSGISGVTILDIAGTDEGQGTLEYIHATTSCRWTKPNGIAANNTNEVDVSTDGNYVLLSIEGDSFVTIASVAASLPGVDTDDTVTISNLANKIWSDISGAQAKSGQTQYRCIYIKNIDVSQRTVKVWVNKDFQGGDYLHIGSRYTVSGTTEALNADEFTAPFSVTFGNYVSLATSLSLTINAGESIGLHLRRTTDPLTRVGALKDRADLFFEVT